MILLAVSQQTACGMQQTAAEQSGQALNSKHSGVLHQECWAHTNKSTVQPRLPVQMPTHSSCLVVQLMTERQPSLPASSSKGAPDTSSCVHWQVKSSSPSCKALVDGDLVLLDGQAGEPSEAFASAAFLPPVKHSWVSRLGYKQESP